MKKSFIFLKASCIALLLTVIEVSEGFTQGVRTSYFMDNVPARLKMNPALQPARGYFNIPAIGALGLSASSNKLSVQDFIDIIENENDFLNSDKFINRLDTKNTMNIDLTTDVISFGFYSGKGFWTVNLGARAIISASIPKTMFEFARYANTDPESQKLKLDYDIKNMELHADIFTEIGLGYSRPVTHNLTLGGRAKLLVGIGNLDAKIDQIQANFNPDDISSYQSWKVKTKGSLETSMKGLEFSHDPEAGYIDDIDFDSPGVSGYGFGIDLGASYKLFDCINISAAILDLGFIKWTKSSTTIATTDSEHNYGDFINFDPEHPEETYEAEAGDVFDFDLIQFQTEEKTKSRRTSLRSTLNLGAEYMILNNKLGFGILSSTQFTQPESYSELTISANYRPRNWFGTTLSYSFLHSEFKTIGIGVKMGPVFIGSDYLMTKAPKEANRLNAYLGVSLPLGKKRADYRRN